MSKIVRYVRKQLLGFSSLFFRFLLFSNLDKKKKFVFCLKIFLAIFYYYKCYNIKCLLLLFQNICISLLQRKKNKRCIYFFCHFQFHKNVPSKLHFSFINQIQVDVKYIKIFEPLHSISDFQNKKLNHVQNQLRKTP